MNQPSDDEWEKLLEPYVVFRDPVHEDIWITEFESKLIDEHVFQRLRHIRQLGTAYLVYPSAQHTRFEHSLGVVYIAQKIIDAVQRNFRIKKLIQRDFEQKLEASGNAFFRLTSRDQVLARMVAILHDAAHMPFGHTLEKEGYILHESQWADKRRVKYFFEEKEMDKHILKFLSGRMEKGKAEEFLNELKQILKAIEGIDPTTESMVPEDVPELEAVGKLDHPYIGDIVGNTICADLVDYIMRDSYFTGLKLSNELRLISSFALVGKYGTKPRLAILLVRKGRVKEDALSSAVEFLRQRYFLAERVYYHRVKAAASAMLIGAVYGYLKLRGGLDQCYNELMELGDDALVHNLSQIDPENYKNNTEKYYMAKMVKKLILQFEKRELYKYPYMVQFRRGEKETEAIDKVVRKYSDPEERYKFQRFLEDLLDMDPGSVVLYVTKKDPGKIARTKCLWRDGEVRELREINRNLIQEELLVIQKKHEELWRLYLFIDQKHLDKRKFVVGLCKSELIDINDAEREELATYAKKDEVDIFFDYVIPPDQAISKQTREEFRKRIESIKTSDRAHQRIFVSKDTMKAEFEQLTGYKW